jgi:hypothetical protein
MAVARSIQVTSQQGKLGYFRGQCYGVVKSSLARATPRHCYMGECRSFMLVNRSVLQSVRYTM